MIFWKLKTDTLELQQGFTLVELLVAAGVFTLVATNVAMLFVSALGVQYQSMGIVKISENAQFALESIAREIRVSKIVSPNTSCATGPSPLNNSVTIEHPVNGTVTYSYDQTLGVLRRTAGGAPQDITSPDVKFTKFSFCVTGSGVDNRQARVTIPMTIVSAKGKLATAVTVSMQTTVAARDITEDFSD